MGWSSASGIFDPIAQALIDAGAEPALKRRVLGRLIGQLQDGDWDCEEDSLEQFRHDPAIVAAFYQHDVGNTIDADTVEGLIEYDETTDQWHLSCTGRDGHGLIGHGPATAGCHNDLIRTWAQHDAEAHGGDGEIPDWMLLTPPDSQPPTEPEPQAAGWQAALVAAGYPAPPDPDTAVRMLLGELDAATALLSAQDDPPDTADGADTSADTNPL